MDDHTGVFRLVMRLMLLLLMLIMMMTVLMRMVTMRTRMMNSTKVLRLTDAGASKQATQITITAPSLFPHCFSLVALSAPLPRI